MHYKNKQINTSYKWFHFVLVYSNCDHLCLVNPEGLSAWVLRLKAVFFVFFPKVHSTQYTVCRMWAIVRSIECSQYYKLKEEDSLSLHQCYTATYFPRCFQLFCPVRSLIDFFFLDVLSWFLLNKGALFSPPFPISLSVLYLSYLWIWIPPYMWPCSLQNTHSFAYLQSCCSQLIFLPSYYNLVLFQLWRS